MIGLSEAAANAALVAQTALVDGGFLRIYGGLRGAPNALLLAELTLGSPAFEPPKGGAAKARTIGREDANLATGEPTWFSATNQTGQAILYGKVNGDPNAEKPEDRPDLILDRQTIEKNGATFVTEWHLTYPVER